MGSLRTRLHNVKRTMRRVRLKMYQASEHVAKTHSASCRRGCAHCCHQVVSVTFPEAIVARLEAGDDWWKANSVEIERRAELWVRRRPSREAWLLSKTPCVFLDGTDCSIYDVRPVSCATYLVVSDPALCAPDSTNEISYLDMQSIALNTTSAGMHQCEEHGVPYAVMPMSVGLVLANCFIRGDLPAVIDCMKDWGLDTSSPDAMYAALFSLVYGDAA